jgi:hypothetical protein
VETIGKIRRAYFVQRKPIKAISRELRVSRKVIRKVLRTGATQFESIHQPWSGGRCYDRAKPPSNRFFSLAASLIAS